MTRRRRAAAACARCLCRLTVLSHPVHEFHSFFALLAESRSLATCDELLAAAEAQSVEDGDAVAHRADHAATLVDARGELLQILRRGEIRAASVSSREEDRCVLTGVTELIRALHLRQLGVQRELSVVESRARQTKEGNEQ